jgi:hypothetical protein
VGAGSWGEISGLSLTSGVRYFVVVRAVDMAGNTVDGCTDGVVIDSSPPLAGTVHDGRGGADVVVQDATELVHANWFGFADPHSQISHYEWCLGTAHGLSDLRPFTNVGLDTHALARGLDLAPGTVVYATVRATNNVGMSAISYSNGMHIAPADLQVPLETLPVVCCAARPGATEWTCGSGCDVCREDCTYCPLLDEFANGDVAGEAYHGGSGYTVSCRSGYALPDGSASASLVCTQDGTWDVDVPECTPIAGRR